LENFDVPNVFKLLRQKVGGCVSAEGGAKGRFEYQPQALSSGFI
jgi:hypothetical protein